MEQATKLQAKAIGFAISHHGDQMYGAHPYFYHLAQVATLVDALGGTEEQVIAAWLHDTVEDTEATLDEISAEFGYEVAAIVDSVTHRDGVSREDYIASLIKPAELVKLCDSVRNVLNLATAHDIEPERRKRLVKKYTANISELLERLAA